MGQNISKVNKATGISSSVDLEIIRIRKFEAEHVCICKYFPVHYTAISWHDTSYLACVGVQACSWCGGGEGDGIDVVATRRGVEVVGGQEGSYSCNRPH